jgi:polysaccharide export outer membrane protein
MGLNRVLGCVVLTAIALAADGAPAPASPGAEPISDAYILQPGDIVQIVVWKEQELQGDVLIRPDGGLSFPLAGDVVAAGRTVDAVRSDVEQRIRRYIPDGVVTVAVKQVNGNRIFVIGKVNHPGDFQLSRPTDVVQALSLAGGMTVFADANEIRVLHRENGRLTATRFRYGDVEKGKRLEQNVLLKSGDTVVVP